MERNIFEAAANKFNATPKKKAEAPKSAVPDSLPVSKKTANGEFWKSDPDILKMLDQMRQMRLKLKTQLTDMYDLGSKYHLDVDGLIKSNAKYSPREMEQILKEGKVLEDQVQDVMAPGNGITKHNIKSKETLAKERKSKTLGARKKNWISVR